MIRCESITKSYGENVVIGSFSYTFADTGLYLLFGESGSGKTTFLNVLSGMIPFDAGRIEIDGVIFRGSVDMEKTSEIFDYITQDTFFVDFLNVGENLRLISNDTDEARTNSLLSSFGLGGKEKQSPSTLSGGERQRLALARAVMSKKSVIFLDEPTSSLDGKNKLAVFELLSRISKSCLVICSSHDEEAKNYADFVIPFTKSTHKSAPMSASASVTQKRGKRREKVRRSVCELRPYMKKWSAVRSRRTDILFGVFLTLALCLLMIADTPSRKLDANASKLYRVNLLEVRTDGDSRADYEALASLDFVREVVPIYSYVLPDVGAEHTSDGILAERPNVEYETSMQYFLPGDKDLFPFSDRIEYGTYFTDEYDVIVTDAYARMISPNCPESLVGSRIRKNLYGIGDVELTIAGILSPVDEFEYRYFQVAESMPADLTGSYGSVSHFNEMYLSSKLLSRYNDDKFFENGSERAYFLIFDDYRALRSFWTANEAFIADKGWYAFPFFAHEFLTSVFGVMSAILLTLSALITLLSVLMYAYMIKTELAYNNKFVSVFNYAGFTVGKVTGELVRLNLRRLLAACAVSGTVSFALTTAVNALNRRLTFIPFEIFTYNVPLLLFFAAALFSSSAFAINYLLRGLRCRSWYENLTAQRDLI